MKTFLALAAAGFLLASGSAMAEDQPVCLKVDRISPRRVLSAGGKLDLRLRLKTSRCVLANDYGAGTTATLTIGHQPGLDGESGLITYSALEGTGPYLDITRTHALETTIEIRAAETLAKGKYQVPALLNYEAINEHGQVVHESLAFTIPIEINDGPPSNLSSGDQRSDLRKTLTTTGEVLLVIAIWPIWVLKCLIIGGCSDC